ncbi:MAG TPA: ATP-binding protein [Thermoanaerobaculia bacterium]|nr:ATP-binding protein [Thermoanaerobaculia bacterium]
MPEAPKSPASTQSRGRGRSPRSVGLRRELELFLPFAALVLIGLCVVILLIHRGAVEGLLDDRRGEALRAVDRLLLDLEGPDPIQRALQRHATATDIGVTIVELDGRVRWTAGRVPEGDPLAPLTPSELAVLERAGASATVLGPDGETAGSLVVIAPLALDGTRYLLRRDQSERRLAALVRGLAPLTATVLGASLGLLALLVLYLRHLLRPFDQLLDRARRVGGAAAGDEEDEVAVILASFDRALEALDEVRREGSADGELAALERMLTQVESGLLLLDGEGRFLALNDSGTALLGLSEPVEGRSLETLLADQPELCKRLHEAVWMGRPVQRAEIAIHRGERERVVGLTLNPLRRDDGTIRGWLGLFADLTESRRLARSRQLGQSLEHVGQLTAGLAHELRNGLATLRGYLTLIERGSPRGSASPAGAPTPDPVESATAESFGSYLHEIRREVDDLHRIAEDFLDFARPGSIRPEPLQPERLARRAAADPALAGAEIEIEVAREVGALQVEGDLHLISRALHNLLDNAVVAHRQAGAAGPVRLIVETGASELRFRVVDQGPGIAPQIRERLFVPFASAREGGTGLGLATAQRIARLHGGRVEVLDRQEGGVEATIVLPVDASDTVGNNFGSSPGPDEAGGAE